MSDRDIIETILENPMAFIWDPLSFLEAVSLAECERAVGYFTKRHIYSISTEHIQNITGKRNLPDRYWPFWFSSEMRRKNIHDVADFITGLWNRPRNVLSDQTGPLVIEQVNETGEAYVYSCRFATPLRSMRGTEAAQIEIVFDVFGGGFYTKNTIIRHEHADDERWFRYIEPVNPEEDPVDIKSFLDNTSVKACLILDRHIGDSLSLFSTHARYLSVRKHMSLTIDISRCPFFAHADDDMLHNWIDGSRNTLFVREPADPQAFDMVFDPYDRVPAFAKKPQDDSGNVGIVSALELLRSHLLGKRRDILDIHMSALRRMGLAHEKDEPEFVRFAGMIPRNEVAGRHTISIFPFGLTADRKYPPDRLRQVLRSMSRKAQIFLAGSDEDAAGLVDAAVGFKNVKLFLHKSPEEVIKLMLQSDVVVCMDSGPLHLARSLRIRPIALYTDKASDSSACMNFPWFVEDGTAEVLIPDRNDRHVAAHPVVEAIRERLRRS